MTVKMSLLRYERARTLLLCAALLMLLFSLIASNIFLILYLVFTVWIYPNAKFFFKPNKLGWLFISIFIFHIISFFWTEDTHRYFSFIERNLSWLIFPLILADKVKEKIDLKLFKKVVFIGLVIFALINELAIINDFFTTTAHEKTVRLFFSRYYQLSNAIRISNIHHSYLSLYNIIGLIFGLSFMKNSTRPLLAAVGSLLLLFYNFQLGSRIFFAISLLFFFYACIFLFHRGDKYLKIFLVSIVVGFIWFSKPILSHSYSRFISRIEATFAPRTTPSEFYRPDRWKICFELIQDNPILGLGPADVEKGLQAKYRENDFMISVSEKYNSHNQYLDYALRFGLIGGLLLISILGLLCVNTCLNRNYDIMLVFLVFSIAMITENYLSVQRGIVPFCMLSALFYNESFKTKTT